MQEPYPDVIYIYSNNESDTGNVEMEDYATPTDDDNDAFSDGTLQDEDDVVELYEDFVQAMTREEFEDALARKGELRTSSASPPADPADSAHEVTLETWSANGFDLKPGMGIEINSQTTNDPTLNDFFRIHSIIQDPSTKAVTLRGEVLRRTRTLNGMLPKHMNELVVVRKCTKEDIQTQIQPLTDIPVELALVQRDIIYTNTRFPMWSFREETALTKENWNSIKEHAVLVCRWRYLTVYKSSKSKQIEEQTLAEISEHEADKGYAVSNADTRRAARATNKIVVDLTQEDVLKQYRESMRRIRVTKSGLSRAEAIDLDTEFGDRRKRPESGNRKVIGSVGGLGLQSLTTKSTPTGMIIHYTFADGFNGGGGVSRGASLAGLMLVWAFDMDKDACTTYRNNFTGVRCYKQRADTFIANFESGQVIDILHLSPPCQKFSPAHTTAGKDDEANEASLFATYCIVQKFQPRIVTIEETSGICTHHPAFFHALIHQLTSLNYSVRYKIMNFAEHGTAQPRKRLVLIAARVGEPLPPFPTPTHGSGPGLKPFTTIWQATKSIRPGMADHEPERCVRKDEPAYDPNRQLRGCITTSGGKDNLHWSGKRSFTLRELASLQGFPTYHVFSGNLTSIRRQIGNAVPPPIYEALCKEIIKTLRATDAMPEPPGSQEDPIDLD